MTTEKTLSSVFKKTLSLMAKAAGFMKRNVSSWKWGWKSASTNFTNASRNARSLSS